jgi:hypothetical protein
LTITLAAACLSTDVVQLTIAGYDNPWDVQNVIAPGPVALHFERCETDTTGLKVTCTLNGVPDVSVCHDLTAFRVRDECLAKTVVACSVNTTGRGELQITRAVPPASGSTAIDLLYFPSDQMIEVTNQYDPNNLPPDEPPTTGVNQHGWHFRGVGKDDAVFFVGAANSTGSVVAGGSIGARVSVANESGAQVSGIRYTLYCARQLPSEGFSDMTRVEGGTAADAYNSIGLRYDPASTEKIADDTPLAKRAIPLNGLSDSGHRIYRRQASSQRTYVLNDDQQMEEEHAIQVQPGTPLGTRYVCRLFDGFGVALNNYDGAGGCIQGSTNYDPGDIPCGAPFTVRRPIFWRF